MEIIEVATKSTDRTLDCPLLAPIRLWSRPEVLGPGKPVPREPGLYAWYFKEVPPGVPTEGCVRHEDLTLLYIGISPSAPPQNGKPPSTQRLADRVRYHMSGNAEGSTLRLTLGCLLSDVLGIQLRRVGSGNRMTFGTDEAKLSEWLDRNAFVTWMVHPEPWVLEEELIRQVLLPLNLDQNRHHPFHPELSAVRKQAKATARMLDVLPNPSAKNLSEL